MSKKIILAGAILAAAVVVYRNFMPKDYYAVHQGMIGSEVIAKLGPPDVKTNHMGMEIWFYGISDREEHTGSFGTPELSFKVECAILFGQNSDRVLQIDRTAGKEWVVSAPKTPSP